MQLFAKFRSATAKFLYKIHSGLYYFCILHSRLEIYFQMLAWAIALKGTKVVCFRYRSLVVFTLFSLSFASSLISWYFLIFWIFSSLVRFTVCSVLSQPFPQEYLTITVTFLFMQFTEQTVQSVHILNFLTLITSRAILSFSDEFWTSIFVTFLDIKIFQEAY